MQLGRNWCPPASKIFSDPMSCPRLISNFPKITQHVAAALAFGVVLVIGAVSVSRAAEPTNQQHRIGVRVIGGVAEFYDRSNGEKFVPRGNNYIRLDLQPPANGKGEVAHTGHSTFDPGRYDALRTRAALVRMHADGYNIVRVFLSENTMGDAREGLSVAYLQNVADMLERAKQSNIYVLLTLQWLPGGKYGQIMHADCCAQFNLSNLNVLSSAGLKANESFFDDLIAGLIAVGAPMDAVFGYELRNELYLDENYPPLSLVSGKVTTASGKTYSMSDPREKQRMIDENEVFWIDSERAEILRKDPTALVGVGFFRPKQPNPPPTAVNDPRLVSSRPAIWESHADFIDLHAYLGNGLNLAQYVENFGMMGASGKPIIMGEFGANTKSFTDADSAARSLLKWQAESCRYGFVGWIFWTWDTSEQPGLYNAVQDEGKIEKALAPSARPNPCV